MTKRWAWVLGVLLLTNGCSNGDADLTVTAEEQEAIRQVHNAQARQPGAEGAVTYLLWEGTTVPDAAGNQVRVVRVQFKVGKRTEPSDVLYLFDRGRPVQTQLNGSGSDWQPAAASWAKEKQ